jgi:amino acid adenylation domain-containing protein
VGLLGVLKAGGAYVPLDPDHPAARVALVLDDAQPPVVLTSHDLQDRLPPTSAACVVIGNDVPTEMAPPSPTAACPANLSYLIYTSGSTGIPKGVAVEHRAVVNHILAMQALLGLRQDDILLSVTTPTFDIATLELFLPLCIGAQLAIAPREAVRDPRQLGRQLVRARATVMQATPTQWQTVLDVTPPCPSLRMVLCGGEPLSTGLAQALTSFAPCVWNLYGPTEASIWSTAHRIGPDDAVVSIGRPIANSRAYIMDARLQPVPIGVVGELYLAGRGLARGYHRMPSQTAERFLPNPFGQQPGERLYRTGDLARWRPDGSIEYVGRNDRQLKIRGHRVEPGDVESSVEAHPAVLCAAVVAVEDESGGNRLVAYYVSRLPVAPGQLRGYLVECLPDYMVPSSFVPVDALPTTPAGKVDYAALRRLDVGRPQPSLSPIPPSTPVERALAQIWCEVLGLDQFGIHDDFFDLGGHSLLATRVAARVLATLGVEVPLRALFTNRTIATLSQTIESCLTSTSTG